ncbi:MAG: hypothetical protein IPK82_27725 [Polyangiaceae bacterium]|nr:hypothetical protein [Polyangiaceae bacterium]
MLIRAQRDLSFVSRGPIVLPNVRAAATSTFNGIYLRPNPSNTGSVPSLSPYSSSPDIWLAGQDAVPNFQTALATDSSYATQSSSNITQGQTNLLYVRGKNGSTASKTVNVTLYYAPSGVIQSPSQWQNNVLRTDNGQMQGNITNLTAGSIGVADATWIWLNPPPPPPGSDHYCLFAQFNDANNSNPFPNVETALDMGALIMNNLGWGWRNTSMIGSPATWSLTEPLSIPINYPTTQAYSIFITPTGYVGWDAEFFASRADTNGNPIKLVRSKVNQDGQMMGVNNVVLEPGWTGLMTVNMYSPDGRKVTPGASVPLSCNFMAQPKTGLFEAISRGLVDAEFMRRVRRAIPGFDVTPTAWIPQGYYNWDANLTSPRAN